MSRSRGSRPRQALLLPVHELGDCRITRSCVNAYIWDSSTALNYKPQGRLVLLDLNKLHHIILDKELAPPSDPLKISSPYFRHAPQAEEIHWPLFRRHCLSLDCQSILFEVLQWPPRQSRWIRPLLRRSIGWSSRVSTTSNFFTFCSLANKEVQRHIILEDSTIKNGVLLISFNTSTYTT